MTSSLNPIPTYAAKPTAATPGPIPHGQPPRSDSLLDLPIHSASQSIQGCIDPRRKTCLLDLPLDLLTVITRLLPTGDVLSCAQTCLPLYSAAVRRLFAHPHVHSIASLDRFLASLTTANQYATKHSEAPALVRRLTLCLPLAELTAHQLQLLGAQCPRLHSLAITDSAALHHWHLPAPNHSGPLATLKIESLLSLTPQLVHLSLSHIDPLDTPHLITHLATHCPQLTSLGFHTCLTLGNDPLTWRSSVLALRRLAPQLESLAIDLGQGQGHRCGHREKRKAASTAQDALPIVLQDLRCAGLRSLTLAGFTVEASHGLTPDALAGMLTMHPALVRLRLERIVCSHDRSDWVESGIVTAWNVPQGRRGTQRTVVLSNVDGITSEAIARIHQHCDGVNVHEG